MAVRPLIVAAIAAALLLVTLATDVAVTRTAKLEVDDAGTWKTIIVDPSEEPFGRAYPSLVPIRADDNGTLGMRLRLDNEYPWAWSEDYVVLSNGREIARGTIDVPARTEGSVTFAVPVARLMETSYPYAPEPVSKDSKFANPSIELVLGGRYLYGSIALEVSE